MIKYHRLLRISGGGEGVRRLNHCEFVFVEGKMERRTRSGSQIARFDEARRDPARKVRIMRTRRRSIVTNCYYKLTV